LATHTSSIKDPSQYESKGYILKESDFRESKANKNFLAPDESMPQSQFLEANLSTEGNWYKKKNFLKNKPGAIFEYSNIAAGLAALVLEKATIEPFNQFTTAYILKPLKMTGTGWSFNEVNFSEHSKLYSDPETPLAFYHLINYPDAGLITSASDLGNYLSELISGYMGTGKILNPESYQELFKAQLTAGNYKERKENTFNDEYNMGVFMEMSAKGQISHAGGDPGVATYLFFNPTTHIGKLLIVNTDLKKEGVQEFIKIWQTLEAYENRL
tara:strand:+ start:117850 stop:118662 length:813 start_codon:yes stop_codon:yes gene_type:complete